VILPGLPSRISPLHSITKPDNIFEITFSEKKCWKLPSISGVAEIFKIKKDNQQRLKKINKLI
jgi:hypothetical protein